jgi:gas vesicle protein
MSKNMKIIIGVVVVAIIAVVAVLFIFGGTKVVGTQEAYGMKQEYEITIKNKKVSKAVVTLTYDEEALKTLEDSGSSIDELVEEAKDNLENEEDDIKKNTEVKKKGKNAVQFITKGKAAEEAGKELLDDEEATKESVKEALEDQGFEVK